MKITLLGESSIRLEGTAGPLEIAAEEPDRALSPFDLLAASIATCVFSVLHSWGHSAGIDAGDLSLVVLWRFAEDPYRVGHFDIKIDWPALPANRNAAAERTAHLCTVHQTLLNPPTIITRMSG